MPLRSLLLNVLSHRVTLIVFGNSLPEMSYKRECQEKNLPFGSMSTLFCLGIQPNLFERALSIREWSCSGRVSYFVPACDAQERFLFPVVPYPCCDGALRF